VPAQYSFNVLQCNPGTFCCRASYDKKNCCNDTNAIIQTSHIGTLLLPSGAEVNTTYSPPSSPSSKTAKAACSTAAVGGALGAVLAAVLIGAAVALFFLLSKRKAIKSRSWRHRVSGMRRSSKSSNNRRWTTSRHRTRQVSCLMGRSMGIRDRRRWTWGCIMS
jgi:hypothetical protein